VPARVPGLAVGITEPNPNLIWARGAREVPEPFARWRDRLAEMRPAYYRLVVDWAAAQPAPGRPPDWDVPAAGCLRDRLPCAGFGGVREQLRAVRSAQHRDDGAWAVLVVPARTPPWATVPPGGCERPDIDPRSRAPRAAPYARFVRELLALGRREGVALPYWAAWNEPNHPLFISPQKQTCAGAGRSLGAARYVTLARTLRTALAQAPGTQSLVVGETAGLYRDTPRSTGLAHFLRELPRDVLCRASIFSQHAYVGGQDPLPEIEAGLRAAGCNGPAPAVWITETGYGAPRIGQRRRRTPAALQDGCRALHDLLARWREDPRVDVAMQYTLREDDLFPTGLVDTALERPYPALAEWIAWGGRRAAADPVPAPTC